MAYTYDDFLKAANNEGMMDLFSDEDLQIAKTHPEYGISLLSLQKDAANATTDDARMLATEAMKQLRSNYTTSQAATGSFVYDNDAAYKEALDAVLNPKAFDYNHETDPTFSSYAKTYRREGQRATEDTLARVAAANGGAVPTSAVTAATQAGDYYASQLADKIPQLQQQAYTNYLNEEQLKQARLNALTADKQQKQNDWQLRYNLQQAERDRLTQLMTTLGYTPTAEELAAAGIGDAEAQLYQNYYKSATSGGGGVAASKINSSVLKAINEAVGNGQSYVDVIDYYRAAGQLDDANALTLYNYFNNRTANAVKNNSTASVKNVMNKTIDSLASIFK